MELLPGNALIKSVTIIIKRTDAAEMPIPRAVGPVPPSITK
jgi:hypothetical protein